MLSCILVPLLWPTFVCAVLPEQNVPKPKLAQAFFSKFTNEPCTILSCFSLSLTPIKQKSNGDAT